MSVLFHWYYSAAIWQIIMNYCYLIKMHYEVKNGTKWRNGIWIATKI